MKRIRNSRAAQLLSWVLTVVMTLPMITGVFGSRSAFAQGTVSAGGNLLTVIIIDFPNKSSVGGEALGRYATDAVAVELVSSARYDVIKRDDVLRTASELGYRAPYDKPQLSRIAQQLGANGIVTGEISYVRADSKKGTDKSVSVGVKLRITDASSGELLNGAAEVGTAFAKPGLSDTDLLSQEAVSKSVVAAIKRIVTFTLPEGIILSSVGEAKSLQVLINRGSRDGIQEGMELIVLRDKVRVGKLRVTKVLPTDSECVPIDNTLGLRPQDKVSAVFPMPDFDNHGTVVTSRRNVNSNPLKSVGQILLVLALGAVVASAIHGGGSVTNLTAEPGLNGVSPVVVLTWKDNMFGGGTIEYHIWRTGGANSNPFNYSGSPSAVAQLSHGYVDQPAPFFFWDGTRSFLQAPINGGNNNGGTGGGTGAATTVTPAAGTGLGFVTGQSYIYQISAIVNRNSSNGSNNNGGGGGGGNTVTTESVETDPVSSGQATPLLMSNLQSPNDAAGNQDLRSIQFRFFSTLGADAYQVEVSTDRTFLNKAFIFKFPTVFGSVSSSSQLLQTDPINLTNNSTLKLNPAYAAFVNRVPNAARPTLYWRVGARNSGDKPGPQNAITKLPGDSDRSFRFIYSTPRSFTPVDMPPPAP